MKTCSFRGAEPTSTTAGLFCDKHEPSAGYTMVPCGNLSCLCCHPINSGKKSQSWSVVDFFSSSMHQFVNGYTTYLNCPAVCFSQIFQCNKWIIPFKFRHATHRISSILWHSMWSIWLCRFNCIYIVWCYGLYVCLSSLNMTSSMLLFVLLLCRSSRTWQSNYTWKVDWLPYISRINTRSHRERVMKNTYDSSFGGAMSFYSML